MRWGIAAFVSAVLVFQWGYFFYGISGLPDKMISEVGDDVAAGEVLKEHFSENGIYFLPNMVKDEEKLAEKYKAGPVAIVHMLRVEGREMMDAGVLISGFCHIFLTTIFLCLLLGLVNNSLPSWRARVVFFMLVGLIMAFYGKIGEAVWWQQSMPWQLINALYDCVAVIIAGIVIATIAPYSQKESSKR